MSTHPVDYLKDRKEASENKALFFWQHGLPNDTPANVRLWVYVNGYSGGCYRRTSDIAKELGISYKTAHAIIQRYLKSGEMAFQEVKLPGGQSTPALVCVVPVLAKNTAAPHTPPTAPADATVAAPASPALPAESVTAPAEQPGITAKEYVDTIIYSTAEELSGMPAGRGTLVRQIDRGARADALINAMRKVPQLMELADGARIKAMLDPEGEVRLHVACAGYKLFHLEGAGEIHNPVGLLIKRASELRLRDTDYAATQEWAANL